MKKHTRVYFKYHNIGEQDYVICEACKSAEAKDIHHIKYRSQGGTDEIDNLIALCRTCHIYAHSKAFPYYNQKSLQEIVNNKLNVGGTNTKNNP